MMAASICGLERVARVLSPLVRAEMTRYYYCNSCWRCDQSPGARTRATGICLAHRFLAVQERRSVAVSMVYICCGGYVT